MKIGEDVKSARLYKTADKYCRGWRRFCALKHVEY